MKNKSPLLKIMTILILIILLPALFFSAYEISTLGEYEAIIERVYEQQLETILFSVNQYAWDFVNAWINKIYHNLSLNEQGTTLSGIRQILETNNEIQYIIFSDTLLKFPEVYQLDGRQAVIPSEFDMLREKLSVIQNLSILSKQGYRKVESIMSPANTDAPKKRMGLFYIQPIENREVKLVVIVIRPELFITEVLGSKIDEITGTQFSIGIFNREDKQLIYPNAGFQFSDIKLQKKLWLFPDYFLGIRLAGESIEDLAKGRFYNSLFLIGILDFLLIIGGWFLIRNIRKEIQLARLKSDFVSNVSHELRTPLSLIRMYSETLEMGRVSTEEKRQDYYRIINLESERLTRLINNILNFSRIESGRKEYKLISVDLNLVVESILEIYIIQVKQNGFSLKTDLQKPLPLINADQEAISEALINLIDNAIKYSMDIKEIIIRTGKRENSVFFEVKDRGIGIEQKYQSAIFDKFFRVSHSLVHDTKGSGLGLSLVKHIIDAHGGRISLDSEIGKGSSFKLFFPIDNQD